MFKPKALSYELDTTGLSINEVSSLHYNMFVAKNYDWWYEVLPDDIVVDIGCSIGAFSAKALDAGAAKVYMVEPNKEILKTAIRNVSDYIIDQEEQRVFPINAAMGRTDVDLCNIHQIKGSEPCEEPRLMSLRQMTDTLNIDRIDFLKINASGAELSILDPDNIDYICKNVRHIALVIHLNAHYGTDAKFKVWREKFLKPIMEKSQVRFQNESYAEKIFAENFNEEMPHSFVVYITNW